VTHRQEPSETLRAADGRVPGRRGRATRERLLDATAAMLETTSWRDLKVVDIAREAGTSPATFYQYFPEVETAIQVLAERAADEGHVLAEDVLDGRWSGRSGFERATALVDAFLGFWDDHTALIRLIDLHIAEGDPRFREIRNHLLGPVTEALGDLIGKLKADGRHPAEVQPVAHAAALVSMLAHVAEHHAGLETWGVEHDALRRSLARLVFAGVTGRRPPDS
jgi:AcrR family transcriptional regulator